MKIKYKVWKNIVFLKQQIVLDFLFKINCLKMSFSNPKREAETWWVRQFVQLNGEGNEEVYSKEEGALLKQFLKRLSGRVELSFPFLRDIFL
jgi:hypothetical protein